MGGTPRPQTITTETQEIANKGACEVSRTMDLQPHGGPPILGNESSLLKIRMLAKREPNLIFTSLSYRIDFYLLKKCFRKVRRNRSAGVDKITAKEYSKNLDENLYNLHERLRRGQYVPAPVRRVWIDKEGGKEGR